MQVKFSFLRFPLCLFNLIFKPLTVPPIVFPIIIFTEKKKVFPVTYRFGYFIIKNNIVTSSHL